MRGASAARPSCSPSTRRPITTVRTFLWFRDRYLRFVYVDRIVVAAEARGRGHARRLYDDLFTAARRARHDQVVCEVNSRPPNPASDAFHAALGFEEVGAAAVHDGRKDVRYLRRAL